MKQTSTILIVDDQALVREGLKELLSDQGYDLAFAKNGLDALTLAAQIIPDVILLDVMMPKMDGFEVCQRLRTNPSLADVPILMLTALEDHDSRMQAIQAGADDFISKPYDNIELKARLRTITNLNRYRKLLTEQTKFQWVVEHTDEAFLILDQKTQILYANSHARFYFHKTKVEPLNETFLALATKHYHCEPQEAWAKGVEPTTIPRYFVRPETATAQAFWLQVDVMEIPTRADAKYLIHLRNVTENIIAGMQKWTLKTQVNHKLRTPITPITGTIQLAKEMISPIKEAAEVIPLLDIAYRNAIRLQSEILTILEYLNVSDSIREELDLCHIADIQSIISTIKNNLEMESVHLFLKNIEDLENTYISFSKKAMELVLTELLSNAKKFHPNGLPTLEIKIILVSKNVMLQICDDGVWLSPEQLSNIWNPYYQGEKYFTGESPGMGLGLPMVASLMWNAGGTCHAYNDTKKQGLVIELSFLLVKN